jgi:hypothetical protein
MYVCLPHTCSFARRARQWLSGLRKDLTQLVSSEHDDTRMYAALYCACMQSDAVVPSREGEDGAISERFAAPELLALLSGAHGHDVRQAAFLILAVCGEALAWRISSNMQSAACELSDAETGHYCVIGRGRQPREG